MGAPAGHGLAHARAWRASSTRAGTSAARRCRRRCARCSARPSRSAGSAPPPRRPSSTTSTSPARCSWAARPNATAAQFPQKSIDGVSADELYDEYNKAFKDEVGRGVAKYVKKWEELGSGAKKQVQLAYAESGLAVNYIMNSASQDQREEAEAMVLAFSDGVVNDTKSYAAWTKNEASNLLNDGQAVDLHAGQHGPGRQGLRRRACRCPSSRTRRPAARSPSTPTTSRSSTSARRPSSTPRSSTRAWRSWPTRSSAAPPPSSSPPPARSSSSTKKGAALLNMAKATEVVDETGKLAKGIEAVKDTKKALDVGRGRRGGRGDAVRQREVAARTSRARRSCSPPTTATCTSCPTSAACRR